MITSILADEIRRGTFSFATFYERRARRLVPPFVPVLVFSIAGAFLLMGDRDFHAFKASVVSALALASNWYFLSTVAYFGGPGLTTPLLHLWSLSIEEQFYIVFPVVLLLTVRSTSIAARWVVPALWVASFLYGLALVGFGRLDIAFYDSAGRFWELLTGCLLALYRDFSLTKKHATWVEFAGALLIAIAIFSFREGIQFPGVFALAPVLGTAMIILSGGRGRIVSPVLKSKLMVQTGLISYALYLWHWPMLSLLTIAVPENTLFQRLIVLFLAVLAAIGSLHLIERPIRTKTIFVTRRSIFSSVAIFAVLVGGVLFLSQKDSVQEIRQAAVFYIRENIYGGAGAEAVRRIEEARAYYFEHLDNNFTGSDGTFKLDQFVDATCSFDTDNTYQRVLECLVRQSSGKAVVLVVGDSIGRDATHALRLPHPETTFVMLHLSGCIPIDGDDLGKTRKCFPQLERLLREAANQMRIKALVLAFRYRRNEWDRVGPTIDIAARMFNRIVLTGPTVCLRNPLTEIVKSTPPSASIPTAVSSSELQLDIFEINVTAGEMARQKHISYVDTADYWCPGNACKLWIGDGFDRPKYIDAEHLTVDGIKAYADFLRDLRL